MNKTPYDKGIEKGIQAGLATGRSDLLAVATALLENRFQSIPEAIQNKLQVLTRTELLELTPRIYQVSSLAELFPTQ